MFSVKTRIKFLKAQFKVAMTKNRYIGNHPRTKRFILGAFTSLVIAYTGFNISLSVLEISVQLDSTQIKLENPAMSSDFKPSEVVVKEIKRDLVDEIFFKESTRGKNNYSKCEAIGKYNRYGFGIPGDGSYLCFPEGQDTVAVAGWIAQKKALGLSDNALLCLYNTGNVTETCKYAN
jgi:hypothetical protein